MRKKNDDDLIGHRSGYQGQDSMRDKAKRILGHEMSTTSMEMPRSFSSPDRSHMRKFKKGGHAKSRNKVIEGGSLTDLYIPKLKFGVNKASACKKGGHIHTPGLNVESIRESENMNKGGKIKGKVMKKAKGGHVNYESHMNGQCPVSNKVAGANPQKINTKVKAKTLPLDASEGEYLKKGGRVKRAAGGAAKVRKGAATAKGKPMAGLMGRKSSKGR